MATIEFSRRKMIIYSTGTGRMTVWRPSASLTLCHLRSEHPATSTDPPLMSALWFSEPICLAQFVQRIVSLVPQQRALFCNQLRKSDFDSKARWFVPLWSPLDAVPCHLTRSFVPGSKWQILLVPAWEWILGNAWRHKLHWTINVLNRKVDRLVIFKGNHV